MLCYFLNLDLDQKRYSLNTSYAINRRKQTNKKKNKEDIHKIQL